MRIGIITMHKVQNYGSALQAYALEKKVRDLGYSSEIIDYIYPNKYHLSYQQKKTVKIFLRRFISYLFDIISGGTKLRKKKAFEIFYKKYFLLSKSYSTLEQIRKEPPCYDLYITGSDQVWNPRFVRNDTTFMLSFVPDGSHCVSYASSFAANDIPEQFRILYAKELAKYSCISVRETTGIEIVRRLTGKDAVVTCDPTLLLTRNEWEELAEEAEIKIESPYILAYILHYSFNPYPEIEETISHIQNELDLPVIYLDGCKNNYFRKNAKVIKTAGPCDFVSLFKNASYIVTSSFHGAAFSLIFDKPIAAIVDDIQNDSRILNLLRVCGKEEYAITKQTPTNIVKKVLGNSDKLDSFRQKSCSFLEEMIENFIC